MTDWLSEKPAPVTVSAGLLLRPPDHLTRTSTPGGAQMRDDANDQGVQIQTANKVSRPKLDRRNILLAGTTLAAASAIASGTRVQVAQGQPQPSVSSGQRPNILIIMGDDIGIPQISAYSMGMMGYRTPNIDRIAREGAIFTDSYGQQSCTAGRASFILGQEPFRTGLLTIGMPGDPHGITDWMPTIADVLKTQGYATGQFGKNHLGDHDEHLPSSLCRR